MRSFTLIIFLLSLYSRSLLSEEVTTPVTVVEEISVPELADNQKVHPFIAIWNGPCGFNGNGSYKKITSEPVRDYIIFDLHKYLDDPKKHLPEFKFFLTREMAGPPHMVIKTEGLFVEGSKRCSWDTNVIRKGYNQKSPYSSPLKCEDDDESPIEYYIFPQEPWIHGPAGMCSFLRVSNYSVTTEGEYVYEINYRGKRLFLDVSYMSSLKNGESFYSNKRRGLELLEKRAEEQSKISKLLLDIQKKESFLNLKACFIEKNLTCLRKYWAWNVYRDVATIGSPPICRFEGELPPPDNKWVDDCGAGVAKVDNRMFLILRNVIFDVITLDTTKFSFDGKKLMYEIDFLPDVYIDPWLRINIDFDNFLLDYFEDRGITC